jgi:ClpP class serine protease
MPIAYPHVAERLFNHAHAIEPFALRAIIDGPAGRRVLSGERLAGKEGKKSNKIRRERLSTVAGAEMVRSSDGMVEYGLTQDGIAVVSIAGVLSRRFDWLAAACGWSTYDALDVTLDSVMKDFRVRGVMLDVDSPGGEAAGMLDICDKIIACRDVKPIWAVANTFAASAAYGIARSASRLLLPRLGQVGSIGCVMIHVDQSVQDEAMGLSYTAIFSGARKIDGWAHAPLSNAARDSFQADADHCRQEFAGLVGRQGRISVKDALSTEADIYSDSDAVTKKLADEVMTFDDALAALTAQVNKSLSTSMAASAAQNGDLEMSIKDQLKSTASPAAIAAGTSTASAAADPASPAVADGTAKAVADTPKPALNLPKPPAPGEKCQTCGQIMPVDGGEDGLPVDPNSKSAGYTIEMAAETMDLCTIAKVSLVEAKTFIAAKAPLATVREVLAKKAADQANATAVDATAKPAGSAEANVAAAWDQVVAEQNAKQPQNAKR